MKVRATLMFFMGIYWSFGVMAASDPVSWSLNPRTGFPPTQVGHQSAVIYTLTNKLPLPAVLVTQYAMTGGSFNVIDDCKNTSLAPNASCTISVGFNPTAEGLSTFQLTYGYHHNRIPLTTLSAVGTGEPSGTILSGQINGLPSTFYTDNTVNYTAIFQNKGQTPLSGCSVSDFTSTGVAASLTSTPGTPPCGSSLGIGKSCQENGTASSTVPGLLTIYGHMTCTSPTTVTATPQASTIVQSHSGCVVHASVLLPLPNTTYQYADNIVVFNIENECPTSVGLGAVHVTASGGDATVTTSPTAPVTTPQIPVCEATLAAQSNCVVMASVIPKAATSSMTVTAEVLPSTGPTISASTSAPVSTPAYTHTIHFINQCPFPVWYGVENSSNPEVMDPTPTPTTTDSYLLGAQAPGKAPIVKSLTIPGTYLGEFFPRTGCRVSGGLFICDTGDCHSLSTGPTAGQCVGDGTSPFTRIEEDFFSTVSSVQPYYEGTYDVSLINGINIPVEFKGLGPANSTKPPFAATPFYCKGAGAPIQPPPPVSSTIETLGNCGWDFIVPSDQNMDPKYFNFVTDDVLNNDCADACSVPGEVCGMAYTGDTPGQPVVMACGKLLGYWTINQSCGGSVTYASGFTTPNTAFNCQLPYTGTNSYPNGTPLNYDIYSCNTPAGPNPDQLGSCYPSTATPSNLCCGARNWNQTPYLTAQDKNAAVPNEINTDWIAGSSLVPSPLYSILWMKTSCPTAYSYPYDDHSGSFRCFTSDAAQKTVVKMDFDVVFCPGGITGALSVTP
ncbi:MAG: hypothetical protein NTW94_07655 [Legionellales bacterium]|nr:hypothetical protein [Legionellales bacterium]